MKTINEIADDHWAWVKELIDTFRIEPEIDIETLEYLYKTAFVHGAKHASNNHMEPTRESPAESESNL